MRVLMAVDLSEHPKLAADFLCRLPKSETFEVTLITVLNPPELGIHASTELWYPEFIDHQREAVGQHQQEISRQLEACGMQVSQHIAHGHIGGEIVRYAEEHGFDWIVIGAVGHSAVGRLLLGSVSDYVATHAKCSVVVLRPNSFPKDALWKVSVAYDHSKSSQKVLEDVQSQKWPSGTSLQVVTAVTPVMVYRDDLFPNAQAEERRRRDQAQEFAAAAAASITNFDGGVHMDVVEGEHTGDAILKSADQFGSHLIVVGDKGHGVFERLMLGSTCRYILHHAKQSVMVAR